MKKNAISMGKVLFLSLCLAVGLALSAEADMIPPTLTATGRLTRLDESVSPPVIELNVNGTPASGPLAEGCRFVDERGNALTREAFFRRYLQKVITIELFEHSGEVIFCRPGV
jgi:hypothetical protein